MQAQRLAGWTLKRIADYHSVSTPRVSVLLKKAGDKGREDVS